MADSQQPYFVFDEMALVDWNRIVSYLMNKDWNGSPEFYSLLEKAAELHNKKSHDYASNEDPFGNYRFAGMLSKLFISPDDAGFVGRIGEKLFRLANLENSSKNPVNESIDDTELDLVVIVTLWMASRRERRNKIHSYPTVTECPF